MRAMRAASVQFHLSTLVCFSLAAGVVTLVNLRVRYEREITVSPSGFQTISNSIAVGWPWTAYRKFIGGGMHFSAIDSAQSFPFEEAPSLEDFLSSTEFRAFAKDAPNWVFASLFGDIVVALVAVFVAGYASSRASNALFRIISGTKGKAESRISS